MSEDSIIKDGNVYDITLKIADLKVERIMKMSDDEIMVEAIREYGSPAAVEKVINRTRRVIDNAIKQSKWGFQFSNLQKFMNESDDQ